MHRIAPPFTPKSTPSILALVTVAFWLVALVPAVLEAGEIPFFPTVVDSDIPGVRGLDAVDVDGDGDLDILGAATGASLEVLWVENTAGDGSAWTTHLVDATFSLAFRVAGGDLDGDGDMDIVAASNGDSDITWWANDGGDGSSWVRTDIDTAFVDAEVVRLTDLDGDGDLDVLAGGSSNVVWYDNQGGASSFVERSIVSGFGGVRDVTNGDLDGDGDADVVGTGEISDQVAWWENTSGDGTTWSSTQVIDASFNGGSGVAVGDVDSDGDLDVLGSAEDDQDIIWYENDGGESFSRTFGKSITWTAHTIDSAFSGASSVVATDLDDDGDLDVLGTARNDNDITWWENTDGLGGTFTERAIASNFPNTRYAIAADLDVDGDLDVIASAVNISEISWWENETVHRSAAYPTEDLLRGDFTGARSVAAGDLDGDGDQDLAGVAFDADGISWWENTGGGSSFVEHVLGGTVDGPISIEILDMDGNGTLDLLTHAVTAFTVVPNGNASGPYETSWWSNDGTGSFTEQAVTTGTFERVSAADVDGDGDMDVLAASRVFDAVNWYENNGIGTSFTLHVVENSFDSAKTVYGGDVDGDGDMDVIAGAFSSVAVDPVAWWENQDGVGGMWSSANTIDADYDGAAFVSAADVDGDGDLDVLGAADGSPDIISWWENTAGDGSAWTLRDISCVGCSDRLNQPLFISGADLDEDGDIDVIGTGWKDGGRLHWYENTAGDGTAWGLHVVTDAFDGSVGATVADLDGDGDPDLAAVAQEDDDVSVWLNRGGQFALPTEDLAAALGNSTTAAVLRITATHNGRSGDPDLELTALELLFEEVEGVPLTSSEANGLLANLFIYRDDGDNSFDEMTDTLVDTVATLDLNTGVQTVVFTDGDANVQVTQGTPVDFFVVVETAGDFSTRPVSDLLISHVTEASSTADDRDHDIDLLLESQANTTTTFGVNAGAPTADLVLTKVDNVDPAVAGGMVTYTLTVTNNGPSNAPGVVVTDALPAGMTLVSTSGCAEDPNGAPTCTLGTINNGASAMYTLTVELANDASGTLENVAWVGSDGSAEGSPGDEFATEQTAVNSPSATADLVLTIADDADPVSPGASLAYTYTVENLGPDTAVGVTLEVGLPAGTTFVSSSGCTEDPNGGQTTCTLGDLAASNSAQAIFTVTTGAEGQLSATGTASSSTFELNSGDNSANEGTTVEARADVTVSITDSADPVMESDAYTYTLSVNNAGPDAAESVVLTTSFGGPVSFVSSSGGCSQDPSGTPTCSLGTVAASDTVEVVFQVTADAGMSGTATLDASVSTSTTETNSGNNSDSESTTVENVPTADVSVEKTVSPLHFDTGATLTWFVRVRNEGPVAANSTLVNDTLPGAVTGATWTCVGSGGALCGNASGSGNLVDESVDLPASGEVLFEITGTANTSSDFTNTASAEVAGGITDPDASNDSDSVTSQASSDIVFQGSFESGDFSEWDLLVVN